MANTRTQRRENELPYIPFGPFQIRLPFIHYKIESVEFIQGLIPMWSIYRQLKENRQILS